MLIGEVMDEETIKAALLEFAVMPRPQQLALLADTRLVVLKVGYGAFWAWEGLFRAPSSDDEALGSITRKRRRGIT